MTSTFLRTANHQSRELDFLNLRPTRSSLPELQENKTYIVEEKCHQKRIQMAGRRGTTNLMKSSTISETQNPDRGDKNEI